MSGDPGPRLNSWKQIARHLGRDVRTVRRWERNDVGMPVHRVPGGRSVFAYTRELDAWLVEGPAPEASLEPEQPFRVTGLRLVLGLAGIAAIATAVVSAWPSPALEITLETLDSRVIARDRAGDVAWTFEHPTGRSFDQTGESTLVVEGQNERDRLHLIATATLGVGQQPSMGAELFAFDEEGQLRWQAERRDAYRFGREMFSDSWVPSSLAVHETSRGSRIAWAVHDYTWWPAALFLLDEQGVVEGPFVNSGWIRSTTLLERPEGDLLLVGGISNSRVGAMLAVLDAADIRGRSPEDAGSEFECLDCAERGPLRYFVFPPTDVNRASGLAYNQTVGVDPRASQIRVTVREGSTSSDVVWVYHFSPEFDLTRVTPGDSFWPTHDLLELEGKLDHEAADCPWQVAPPILSWTAEGGWSELRESTTP